MTLQPVFRTGVPCSGALSVEYLTLFNITPGSRLSRSCSFRKHPNCDGLSRIRQGFLENGRTLEKLCRDAKEACEMPSPWIKILGGKRDLTMPRGMAEGRRLRAIEQWRIDRIVSSVQCSIVHCSNALNFAEQSLERERGFEPPTLALARRCSTPELFPHPL